MFARLQDMVELVMRSKYNIAPIGAIFGKWKVIEYSHYSNEHYWKVLCSGCNKEYTRRAGQLVNKRSSGCQSCNAFEREKYSFWEGIDGISIQYLSKLKFRKKEIQLTLQDLVDQWKLQKGLCAYTGLVLTLVSKDTEWAQSSASIDRIDSTKGYIKGNIQWVHKKINIMKMDLSDSEFITWCSFVSNYRDMNSGKT